MATSLHDEPDPRPPPEAHILAGSISDLFDALVVALPDTRLEPDLEDLLWSTVNVFHRAIDRIERELEDELSQQRPQREQDGSEVKSVELERMTVEGQTLIERRNAFELMRDQAADQLQLDKRKWLRVPDLNLRQGATGTPQHGAYHVLTLLRGSVEFRHPRFDVPWRVRPQGCVASVPLPLGSK